MNTVDLSAMTKEELEEYALKTSKELDTVSAELEYYKELFRRSQAKQFGKKNEQTKVDDGKQESLFNEIEAECDETLEEPKAERACPVRKSREKGKKDKLLKALKKVEPKEYILTEEEKICPVCGQPLQEMSKRVHREVEIIPAKVVVRDHIQHIYSCRNCEKNETEATILAADMPKPLLRSSILSPSLGAYIIQRKYENRDPLEKIAKDLKLYGVNIGKANLSNWMMNLSERYFQPLYDRMQEILLSYDIIQADETSLQVLQEKERSNCYMWMFRSGIGRAPIVLYHYDHGSRAGFVPESFLQGYCGYLQTDGYKAYNHAGKDVIRVGCLAHARRRYADALNGLTEKESPRAKRIQQGVIWCDKIFALDAQCRSLKTAEERTEFRQTRMWETFEAFFAWAENELRKMPPKSLYLEALNYTVNNEDVLRNSLLDERLEISNNRGERAIKPFVMGRTNWLFCNTARGATSSAVLYSIVVTAMENDLLPFEYLNYLLDQVRRIDLADKAAIDRILPWSDEVPDECRRKGELE